MFEGNVDLRAAAAQSHMTRGWDLYKAGQQEMAVQELLRAEELAPLHPGPPSMLGTILAAAQRKEEARTQLTIALKLAQAAHPEFQSIWLPLIKAQLRALE